MNNIKKCSRCLYSDQHPLGLVIDDEGICSGCRIHEEKDKLDWRLRWRRLEHLVKEYRSLSKSVYDCIIPVSGGQDSYFLVHLVKERLGLNPLLVSYNKYWNTPLGIRNLANLRIRFNCDMIHQNVNPNSVKKIVRTTLRQLGSVYWHCIAGETVFPVQTAVRYKIPLIIWGAHQGMEQVGMFSHEHEVEMNRRYRKDHDLMGFEADDLLSNFDTLSERDIWQYRYPEDHDLNKIGVRGIYLNNFVRWDPKAQHEKMVDLHQYQSSKLNRTFDTYDFVDSYIYMHLHDLIKSYKCGYSKVTDHACREIRHGRLSQSQAEKMVLHFESQPIQYLENFTKWLDIDIRSLQYVLDLHRNKSFWRKENNGAWVRSGATDSAPTSTTDAVSSAALGFIANGTLNLGKSDQYVTIGKGWQ